MCQEVSSFPYSLFLSVLVFVSHTHLLTHSHTQPSSLSLVDKPRASEQGKPSPESGTRGVPPPSTCGFSDYLLAFYFWGRWNPALKPCICFYLHPDFLSGLCLSSAGPVKEFHLVGVRAQAWAWCLTQDPLVWHLSMRHAGGKPCSLAGGLGWPGQVGPKLATVGSLRDRGRIAVAGCPPRASHIPER
jgi:hypothetical protein